MQISAQNALTWVTKKITDYFSNGAGKTTAYTNVLTLGCKYDGINDDSQYILNTDLTDLYFPEGSILLTREAVTSLFNKRVTGEGLIIIRDFHIMANTKYGLNNRIYVKDFYNDYINCMSLPNVKIPATDFWHQNCNGWINPYKVISDAYTITHTTCWGQVYPIKDEVFTEDDGNVTVCFSVMDYFWYDKAAKVWRYATNHDLPAFYGFYHKNYQRLEDGSVDVISISNGGATVTKYDDHVEISFPAKTLNERVLHFGVSRKTVPLDDELYLIGEFDCWIKEESFKDRFVANVGFDLYADVPDGEKPQREYCGSRYVPVELERSHVCVVYDEGKHEILNAPRVKLEKEELVLQNTSETVLMSDGMTVAANTKLGLSYREKYSAIMFNDNHSDILFKQHLLNKSFAFQIAPRIRSDQLYMYLGSFMSTTKPGSGSSAYSVDIRIRTGNTYGGCSLFDGMVSFGLSSSSVTEYKKTVAVAVNKLTCGEKVIFIFNEESTQIDVYYTLNMWHHSCIEIMPFGVAQNLYSNFIVNRDTLMSYLTYRRSVIDEVWLTEAKYTNADVEAGRVFIVDSTSGVEETTSSTE